MKHERDTTDSERPKRTSWINVENGGLQVSWKTAAVIVAAIASVATGFTAFTKGVAHSADIEAHNLNPEAHPLLLEGEKRAKAIAAVVQDQAEKQDAARSELREMRTGLEATKRTVDRLRESFDEDRAETIADRVADRVKDARRSRDVWMSVKAQALRNLAQGRPARDGIEDL